MGHWLMIKCEKYCKVLGVLRETLAKKCKQDGSDC